MPDPDSNNNDSNEIVREQSESVAATNLKVQGDGPAHAMNSIYQGNAQSQLRGEHIANLGLQNAISNQARIDTIANAVVTAATDKLLHPDPMEAVAVNKIMTGNDLGQQIASLMAVLGGGQIGAKTAQTTPPNTAG